MSRVPGVRGRSLEAMLAPQGRRRQRMPGFDREFADIVDYIVKITHRIWDERMIGLIRRYYAADCPVWMLAGPVEGAETIIDGTIRTLAEFPDRTMWPEAVIWSGNGRDGFLSSHRIRSTATHLGPGAFGPPTGRRIEFRTIADCLCRANRIVEEWLVRDMSAMAIGLGLSPRALAAGTPASEATRHWWARMIEAVRAAPPLRAPRGDGPAALPARLLGATPPARQGLHAPGAHLLAPGGRRIEGAGAIAGWWDALHAGLADPAVRIDHVAVNPVSDDPADGQEVAARWWLAGRDAGVLGEPPTGRDLLLLGISHWRVCGGAIAEEVTLFDEVALWRQLLAP
ncbi:MAG: ester cyclase [Sphingomonadaceae bacterium]